MTLLFGLSLLTGCAHLTDRLQEVHENRTWNKVPPKDRELVNRVLAFLSDVDASAHNPRVLDSSGDVNRTPIRAWVVRDQSGVRRLYLVGHADLRCCFEVSSFESELEKRLSPGSSWVTFGWSIFEANSPKEREILNAAFVDLLQIRRGSACAGTLSVMQSEQDFIVSRSKDIVADARRAYRLARESSRPVLSWVELETAHPAIVPVLVADRTTHELKTLVVPLDFTDIDLPPEYGRMMSANGVAEYLADLRELRKVYDIVVEIRRLLRRQAEDPPMGIKCDKVEYQATHRDLATVHAIQAAKRNAEEILPWLEHVNELAEFLAKIPEGEFPPGDLTRARLGVAQGRAIVRESAEALKRLNALPGTPPPPESGPDGVKTFGERSVTISACINVRPVVAGPNSWGGNFGMVLQTLERMNLEQEIRALDQEIAAAEALKGRPPSDPLPSMLDAALRGWPISFMEPEVEAQFDGWLQTVQPRLWEKIHQTLESMDADARTPGSIMGVFHSSEIVFRVSHDESGIWVTPYYVLPSSFYIVAEPARGLVRYESSTADQNLDSTLFTSVMP